MSSHTVVAQGHQRKAVPSLHDFSKFIDQGGYDQAMLTAERLAMNLGDGLLIFGLLLPDLHYEAPYPLPGRLPSLRATCSLRSAHAGQQARLHKRPVDVRKRERRGSGSRRAYDLAVGGRFLTVQLAPQLCHEPLEQGVYPDPVSLTDRGSPHLPTVDQRAPYQ